MCVLIFTNSDRDLDIIHKNLQSIFFPHTGPFNLKHASFQSEHNISLFIFQSAFKLNNGNSSN